MESLSVNHVTIDMARPGEAHANADACNEETDPAAKYDRQY
jgi:hypothetical protein